jgi:chaperone modulatory protein CbpM
VRYPLARPVRLDLDSFARACSTHPELIRRFVGLGLLEAERDAAGRLWFRTAELATFARIQRLRSGFGLDYAALDLVLHLLDRIAVLEAASRRVGGDRSWTRTS